MVYQDATGLYHFVINVIQFIFNSVGVRQSCLLSPVLFNIFLKKIMQYKLKDHESTIFNGGRPISNLRFVDDIDVIAGSSNELQNSQTR